jgi:hypothetical protein
MEVSHARAPVAIAMDESRVRGSIVSGLLLQLGKRASRGCPDARLLVVHLRSVAATT